MARCAARHDVFDELRPLGSAVGAPHFIASVGTILGEKHASISERNQTGAARMRRWSLGSNGDGSLGCAIASPELCHAMRIRVDEEENDVMKHLELSDDIVRVPRLDQA